MGAVPSCYLWHALHLRFGNRNSLTLNLVLQSLGIALPAVSPAFFSSSPCRQQVIFPPWEITR
ncbi:MAG: hypothetical protein ACTH3D_10145 [Halomonas sp.]|uniref:hypothetical protein n=1 Tax=Halomonas sp. TaxID=1486246 RepID=UPI003F8E451C